MEEWCGAAGRGFGWRVGASILIAFGWLIFILIYAGFFSFRFSLFQNIIVTLASIVAGIMVLGLGWSSYGQRHTRSGETHGGHAGD
jgi:hypothetical protein